MCQLQVDQARQVSPLLRVSAVCAQDGSPLSVGQQLCGSSQLQVGDASLCYTRPGYRILIASSYVHGSNAHSITHVVRRFFVLFVLYASLFLATMIGMMAPFVVQWMQVCVCVRASALSIAL